MYLSRTLTTKPLTEIAKFFGGKDHTTVIYACQTVEKKIKEDASIKREIDALIEIIKT